MNRLGLEATSYRVDYPSNSIKDMMLIGDKDRIAIRIGDSYVIEFVVILRFIPDDKSDGDKGFLRSMLNLSED